MPVPRRSTRLTSSKNKALPKPAQKPKAAIQKASIPKPAQKRKIIDRSETTQPMYVRPGASREERKVIAETELSRHKFLELQKSGAFAKVKRGTKIAVEHNYGVVAMGSNDKVSDTVDRLFAQRKIGPGDYYTSYLCAPPIARVSASRAVLIVSKKKRSWHGTSEDLPIVCWSQHQGMTNCDKSSYLTRVQTCATSLLWYQILLLEILIL